MSIRASARLRALALVLLLIVATVVAITVPLPRPEQIREWAQGLGPSLPAVFLICHALITVAPIPRTVFTLAAGLLFGPLTGISVALVASTISAVLALLLVRKLGRDAVAGVCATARCRPWTPDWLSAGGWRSRHCGSSR